MNYVFKMAVKNVLRNRRRTILTFSSVTFGIFLMVICRGIMQGINADSTRNLINYQTSHMKVFAKGYFKDMADLPLDKIIKNPVELESKLMSSNYIKSTTDRVQFPVTLNNGINDLSCMGVGIDVKKDAMVFDTYKAVVDGQYLEENDSGIIMGCNLAKDFKTKTGDWLVITGWTIDGAMNALDFKVKGIFKTGNPYLDNNAVFMSLQSADDFLGLKGSATEIDIKLKDGEQLAKAKKSIYTLVNASQDGYEVFTWKKLAEDIIQFITLKTMGGDIMGLFILIIASVGIINTMLMSVFERVKEIGMMMAMGMKADKIRKMFLMEGFVIGLFGSTTGSIMGYLLVLALHKGIDFSSFGDLMAQSFAVSPVIYPAISPGTVAGYFIFGIVICTIASLYPSYKASKFEPVEALRK